MVSNLEDKLAKQIADGGLPAPARDRTFHPTRKWRADFVWFQPYMVIVEVEGGSWVKGRHTQGAGFEEDCEKYNAAVLQGFRLLRFTGKHIRKGVALATIREALQPALEKELEQQAQMTLREG